jgi:hypothetical protein
MTEISLSFDPCISLVRPRGRLEIDESLLLDTLDMLGEDLTADNPPIDLSFGRDDIHAVGHAERVGSVRKVSVAVCRSSIPGMPFMDAWRPGSGIDDTLLHELVHAVDLNLAKHLDRPTKLGRMAAIAVNRGKVKFDSPMESRAYAIVDKHRRARSTPRIVRVVS